MATIDASHPAAPPDVEPVRPFSELFSADLRHAGGKGVLFNLERHALTRRVITAPKQRLLLDAARS